jgi:hypothetical protein
MMREDFLHYVWRYQRYFQDQLATSSGESVAVIDCGELNLHGGPDFLNARIRIDGTLWAGHVEIHVLASEWNSHGHGTDAAYDNVILHVVLEEDCTIFRPGGERLACLVLGRRIPTGIQAAYFRMLQERSWIPCQSQWDRAGATAKQLWLERMSVERLERQTHRLRGILEEYVGDWEEAFYCVIARNLGHPANADPFEALARRTPRKLLLRKRGAFEVSEALLFGQAGFLEGDVEEGYPLHLQQEYRFLQAQYGLAPMRKSVWRFMRMRPANFPTLRIAQLARLVCQGEDLFDKAMVANGVGEWQQMFEVKVSQYWRTHYTFGEASPPRNKCLGKMAVHSLLINAVAPFLFLYGIVCHGPRYCQKAIQLLQELPPEDNHILRKWEQLGLKPGDAAQGQGLLQLKTVYCDHQKCTGCGIGHEIFKNA